jgi:hypothetical protein
MRQYDQTLHFSIQQMAEILKLQDAGKAIEGAMCGFDVAQQLTINRWLLQ